MINESSSETEVLNANELNANPEVSGVDAFVVGPLKFLWVRGSELTFDDHAPCRYSLQFSVIERFVLGGDSVAEPLSLLAGGTGTSPCALGSLGSLDCTNVGQK